MIFVEQKTKVLTLILIDVVNCMFQELLCFSLYWGSLLLGSALHFWEDITEGCLLSVLRLSEDKTPETGKHCSWDNIVWIFFLVVFNKK